MNSSLCNTNFYINFLSLWRQKSYRLELESFPENECTASKALHVFSRNKEVDMSICCLLFLHFFYTKAFMSLKTWSVNNTIMLMSPGYNLITTVFPWRTFRAFTCKTNLVSDSSRSPDFSATPMVSCWVASKQGFALEK